MVDSVFTVVSSDGHAGALMADYRPYLDPEFREDFDAFLVEWNEKGSRNFDEPALRVRLDDDSLREWREKMIDTGRVDGYPDVHRRLSEMEQEGVAAEVLFPDFGVPFELYSPSLAAALGYEGMDGPHRRAAYRAFNRWLVDYVSAAPERFVPLAAVSWDDVSDAVREIRWAREHGFKGVVLPAFDPQRPLFDPAFEPIWNVLEELNMVANAHSGMSSTSNRPLIIPPVVHPACAHRLFVPEMLFYTHNILDHLVWGGVLEKHPGLKVAFTEMGSSWVVPALRDMDYIYLGHSYFRTDFREVLKSSPSEYFQRQCWLGSSTFSQYEVRDRYKIGLDKMMLGMDFPHHEGTLIESTPEYLRATLGAEKVPVDEARMMLTDNAASLYDVDLANLAAVAKRIGLRADDILRPPDKDIYPRGDVHKPSLA